MEKIVIIGSSGAGKSIFAQRLGAILDIEVVHLDRYFWRPDWKEHPRKERLEIQQRLLQEKKRWIIEGTYLGSSDDRLNAADTIIFLDIPWFLCLWRVIVRHIAAHRIPDRPDIPEGCTDRMTPLSLWRVLAFPLSDRGPLLKKIKGLRAQNMRSPTKKMIYIYRSSRQAERLLQQLSAQQQEEHTYCSQDSPYDLASQSQHNIDDILLKAAKGGGVGMEYIPAFDLFVGTLSDSLVLRKSCSRA